jgi:hypothetical protein
MLVPAFGAGQPSEDLRLFGWRSTIGSRCGLAVTTSRAKVVFIASNPPTND